MKTCWALILAAVLLYVAAGCEARAGRVPSESLAGESGGASETEAERDPPPEPESGPGESSGPADDEGARKAAEEMLASLQTGNPDSIREHIDYKNLLLLEENDQSEGSQLAILKRMQYEILDVSAEEESAVVAVRFTNADMSVTLSSYLEQARDMQFNNALSDSPLSEEELTAEYQRLFEDMLDSAPDAQTTVSLRLQIAEGKWRAQVSDALRDAATGGYFTARSKVGTNAGGGQS